MRVALSSYTGLGAWFVLRLLAEGHKVDYFLSEEKYEDVLRGLIPRPKLLNLDHRSGAGYPSYKPYDLSLFDLTGRSKQADASKLQCPTIGDGSFEHLLEDDREEGLRAMEAVDIRVPPYERFENPGEAKAFIKSDNKRYVYKPFSLGSEGQDVATTYVAKNAEDMLKNIDHLFEISKGAPFILQEFITGIEASVAGFFNGTEFYMLTCTLEEKKFMNDGKGPNTGCSGNLVFALSEESKLYREGLGLAVPLLSASGFRGMIDLNTIVTEGEAYGLEWTPRFGYLADSTIAAMYGDGYGEMLQRIASGRIPHIKWAGSYGFSVTLSIPPYPTEVRLPRALNIPIEGVDPTDQEQLCLLYLYDAMLSKDRKGLTTSGNYGYICAPIGVGDTLEAAAAQCDRSIEKIQIPNMQLRTDMKKCTQERYDFLERHNWI